MFIGFWAIHLTTSGMHAVAFSNTGIDYGIGFIWSEFFYGFFSGLLGSGMMIGYALGHELVKVYMAKTHVENATIDPIILWPIGGLTFCASGPTFSDKVKILVP